jgi:hypothetical protein
MTKEELKKAIRLLITWYDGEGDLVDGIVMLIHEAGYRSPEEVDKMVEHRIYEMYANETYQP